MPHCVGWRPDAYRRTGPPITTWAEWFIRTSIFGHEDAEVGGPQDCVRGELRRLTGTGPPTVTWQLMCLRTVTGSEHIQTKKRRRGNGALPALGMTGSSHLGYRVHATAAHACSNGAEAE